MVNFKSLAYAMVVLSFLFYFSGIIYLMVKGKDRKNGKESFPQIVTIFLGLSVFCSIIVFYCIFKLKNFSDMDFRDKTNILILFDSICLLIALRVNEVVSVPINSSVIFISLLSSVGLVKNL